MHCHSVRENEKWISSSCPLAPWEHENGRDTHPSFGIAKQTGTAFCFSCGVRGDLPSLLMTMQMHSKRRAEHRYDWSALADLVASFYDELEIVTEPFESFNHSGFHPFDEIEWSNGFVLDPQDDYLLSRGIPANVIEQLDIRIDIKRDRACFPIRNFSGQLAGITGRSKNGQEPRYLEYRHNGNSNPFVLLGEHNLDFSQPIVLTEGPFDWAKLSIVLENVCALRGAPSNKKFARVADAEVVITAFDAGAGGDRMRAQAEKVLPMRVMHALPETDFGDEDVSLIRQKFETILKDIL